MDKEITRVLNFTAAEVREAIIARLEQRDQPYPAGCTTRIKFSLSDSGATLEWVETAEIDMA